MSVAYVRMGKMEISSKSHGSFFLKGKKATLLIHPADARTFADSVIVPEGEKYKGDPSPRLVIAGPGDYEVGGIAVGGRKINGDCVFRIIVDAISVLYLSSIPKEKASLEQFGSIDILLLGDYSDAIYQLDAKIAIPFTDELATKLGKEVEREKKLSVTKEKLPQDLKVVMIHG